ncbi:MAG: DUF4832 domain-containing protein [Meiothermus sp.]|nr:DUF4832 domain-containing protein [Meiothermus sp.]
MSNPPKFHLSLIGGLILALALAGCGDVNPLNPRNDPPSKQGPADPESFVAMAASATSVNLSWSAVTGADKYILERKTGSSSFAAVGGSGVTTTSFTDNGLNASTAYTYRLRSINAQGSSGGLERSVTTPATSSPSNPAGVPATPGQLTATVASATSVNLAWTAVGGATRYALERRTGGGAFTPVGGDSLTSTSFTDTGLSPSTSYTYRVSAVNGSGSSSPRESATVTTPAQPVNNPADFSATATSSSSVNLTWTAVGGATRYALERRTGGGAYATIGGDSLTSTSFTDTGLSPSTAYTYRVRTVVGANFSSGLERTATTQSAPLPPTTPPFDVQGRTYTYAASSEDFLNPERGIHIGFQLMEGNDYSGIRSGTTYPNQPGDSPYPASVLLTYLRLSEFRSGPLSADFLTRLRARLGDVRRAGIKVIIRPYYAFPGVTGNDDAPLSVVLEHLRQLAPVFQENSDVIVTLQQGFIGYWGEGHSSTNGLESDANRRTITQAMLDAMPPNRTVQIRRVRDISPLIHSGPLPAGQEFGGSAQSRLGLFNDCFLANFHDAGTYRWNATELATDQRYLERLGEYAPVIGETCEIGWGRDTEYTNPRSEYQRSDCTTTLRELARFRWSVLSGTQYRPTIARWRTQGCYGEISRRLGYRFRLTTAVIPETVSLGSNLRMAFDVVNEGFAPPFNPRGAQIVLRNRSNRQVSIIPLNADPRRWAAGQTTRVYVDLPLPGGVGAGEYDVFLNLPDGAASLAADPRYSIRLANTNVWEAATGYNALGAVVRVQ